MFVADVNNDGYDDIVTCSPLDSSIVWWQRAQNDSLTWTSHILDDSIPNARNVIAVDIDGDLDQDVTAGGVYIDQLYWWENVDGNGEVWTRHFLMETSDGLNDVSSADFNGDGSSDILAVRENMVWLENPGNSDSLWIQHSIGTNYNPVASHAEDMDGDGDIDVADSSRKCNS